MSEENNKHEGMIMITIDGDNKQHWVKDREEFLEEEERLLIAKERIEDILKTYNLDIEAGCDELVYIVIKENGVKYVRVDNV